MLLNFQRRFAPKIRAKVKRHTIRARRKVRPRVGEICHCYTGLRQKGAELLGRWPCVGVQYIEIYCQSGGDGNQGQQKFEIWIDDVYLSPLEYEELARSDGFTSHAEMMDFWRGRLPFHGDIIHWNPD